MLHTHVDMSVEYYKCVLLSELKIKYALTQNVCVPRDGRGFNSNDFDFLFSKSFFNDFDL